MKSEIEATFLNVNKDKMRATLKEVGAVLKKPEFMQRRVVFHLPTGHEIKGGWLRVRDESDKVTMSLKVIDGDRIEDQKEACIKIDNFDEGVAILSLIGCEKKAYQESKRELWLLDGVEVTIDEWPFLEPYVEVEGETEEIVKEVSEKLGFDYSKAYFCAVGKIYSLKYGIDEDIINNKTPEILFNGKNPFVKE